MNFFPLFQVEVDPPDRPSAALPRRHKTAHELSESEEEQEDMEDPRDPDFMPGDSDDDPDSDFPDDWDVDGDANEDAYGEADGDADGDARKENWDFINAQKAPATVKKTNRDILRFQVYVKGHGEPEAFENIPPKRLDSLMSCYVRTVTKLDGGEYEPSTITGIMGSLDRYLREHDYQENIQHSALFKSARDMVKAKRSFLKSIGKGNCPNKAQALTEQEIEILWNNNGFNYQDADCLYCAIWFLLALNFGLRGSHECRQLTVGDLTVREHFNGQQYLELNERVTKTRRGDGNRRAFAPKAWSNGTPRCPVFIFEQFMSRRPARMGHADSPFFLNVNRQRRAENPIWYAAKPMGRNILGAILRTAAQRAGITRPGLTNHAVRATSISRLLNSGVDPVIVAQHSGHKDPNSIRHYATADLEVQRYMGSVLARPDMRAHGILPAPQPAALPEPTAVPGPSLALTQTAHNADPEATRSATSKCRAPPTTTAGVMSGLSNPRVAGRRPVSAALGRAPSPPPEDTVGQDEVSLFIQYFGKYLINASVHGKYFEPLDIVSDVCNCSARCLMTFSFHCIACSMNVRSMFVKFSVCLQGVFDLNLDVPRSRLSLRRPAAAHTSGAEAQPKVRRTEAPRAAPAPTAVAAELAPPALAVNDHAHPPRPDGLQDPPAAALLPAALLPAAPLPAALLPAAPLPAILLPADPLPAALLPADPLPVDPLPADPLPVEADLPVDDDDDDVIIPASQMSAAGAAFAAQISNSAQQVMGNMFRGAVIHNPRYEFHFHFNKS